MMMNEQQQSNDPWETVAQRYAPGQLVTGSITRAVPFGAFASLEEGIEGFIPRSELLTGTKPLLHLQEGLQLPLRILELDPERHHLRLSLNQAGR